LFSGFYYVNANIATHFGPLKLNGTTITTGSAVPTTGTFKAGSIILNNTPGSPIIGWRCTDSGTFSSASITGNTTSGSNVIDGIADTSEINIDDYVYFSSGFDFSQPDMRVLAKTANTLTVTSNATSTQTGVTISTPDPVFETFGRSLDNELIISVAGKGISIKEGTNARAGVVTLVAGTATVSTTVVATNSRIKTDIQSLGTVTTPKAVGVSARVPGTSFTIMSSDNTDTSVIYWEIGQPA